MDKRDAEVAQDPVAQLAAKLRDLRFQAGKPSVMCLMKLTEKQGVGRAIPRSTIQDKLSGTTAPTLDHVMALVAACAEHAATSGYPLSKADIDPERWKAAWLDMQRARAGPRRRQAGAARAVKALTAIGSWPDKPEVPEQIQQEIDPGAVPVPEEAPDVSAELPPIDPVRALTAFTIPQLMYRWYDRKTKGTPAETRKLKKELDQRCADIGLHFESDQEIEKVMLPTGYGARLSSEISVFPQEYSEYFDLGAHYLLSVLYLRDRDAFDTFAFDWENERAKHVDGVLSYADRLFPAGLVRELRLAFEATDAVGQLNALERWDQLVRDYFKHKAMAGKRGPARP